MLSLVRDVKFAARSLLKSPGFAITAVLMLALGIGATTAIFSIVEGVLLRPLPFPHPGQLVVLSDILEGADVGGNGEAGVTAPDVRNYTRDTRSFNGLGGYQGTTFELSGTGNPASVNAARMTPGVFAALAVQPVLGRVFTAQEDEKHQAVAVLSYATWQSRFGGKPTVLGSKILLDRKPYIVIGVMPRNFEFPLASGHLNEKELWVPMSFGPAELAIGGSWNFQMVGRLKPGLTAAQAVSDAKRVADETMRNYPAPLIGFHIHPVVRPLHEETVEQARPLVRTLFLAVAIVLLIACANLAGLLLVRAIRNRREIAVRLALGASPAALLRQTILESLVLSTSGGLLGLVLAAVALRAGVSLLPETLPRLNEIGLDWSVVGFALGLAVLTGFLCGLVPAFAAMRTGMNEVLKEGGRTGSTGAGNTRLRAGLVVGQIAVATALLAVSGLLLRSFEQMRNVNLGFHPDHALAAEYSLPQQQYATQASVDRFNQELLRRLEGLPGITSAGITTFLPASGYNSNSGFIAEGSVIPKGRTLDLATTVQVQGNYFQAMGIPLLRGRLFSEDDRNGTQLVVIVNHKLADQTWPGQDPIGKRLRLGVQAMQTPWATVVGEVADAKEGSPDTPAKQSYYSPIDQAEAMLGPLGSPSDLPGNGGYIALRTALAPEQMENVLRAIVHALDPQLALTNVQTMDQVVSDSEAPRRFNTVLISSFAGIAVLLAVLGIYSVTAFSVALRSQEMAIRMALGAQQASIIRLVLYSAAKLAAAGCALGLAATAGISHLLHSFLFGVDALDPGVLAGAVGAMLLVALAASLLPAHRASTVDPMEALRAE